MPELIAGLPRGRLEMRNVRGLLPLHEAAGTSQPRWCPSNLCCDAVPPPASVRL